MIKIKPVLVNIVVLYSLMLGMMVLNYLDAIDSGGASVSRIDFSNMDVCRHVMCDLHMPYL